MPITRFLEFTSAEVDGLVFKFEVGILEVTALPSGLYGWEATAYYRTVSADLERIMRKDMVRVEFDALSGGRLAGPGRMAATRSLGVGARALVKITGTSRLEGWTGQ